MISIEAGAGKTPVFFCIDSESTEITPLCPKQTVALNYLKVAKWQTPRALLRPKYGEKYSHVGPVFLRFSDIIESIQKQSFDVRPYIQVIIKNNIDVGIPQDVVKKLPSLSDSILSNSYSVLCALIYRIGILQFIKMKESQEGKLNPLDAFYFDLLCDTHIDLVFELCIQECWCDSQILSDDFNLRDPTTSIYKLNYPHDMRFESCYDFPDISPVIGLSNLWTDPLSKKKDTSLARALCTIVIKKSQIFKCMTRNIEDLIVSYLDIFPDIFKIFRMSIKISLLGNYATCGYRPSFTTRVHVSKFFSKSKMVVSNEIEIKKWIRNEIGISVFCMRELYSFIVERNIVLDEFMTIHNNWSRTKFTNTAVMDVIREFYNKTFSQIPIKSAGEISMEQFAGTCKKIVNYLKREVVSLVLKHPKMTPEKFMQKEFSKFHEKNIMDKSKMFSETYEDYVSKETLTCIKLVVHKLFSENDISSVKFFETRWLKYLGVGEKTFEKFRWLWFHYCCEKMSDNSVKKHVKEIYDMGQTDFHIIRIYFNEVILKMKNLSFDLPRNIAQKQEEALRFKYKLMPWEKLSKLNRTFYMCQNCSTLAHVVISPSEKESLTHVNTYTPSSIGYNFETMQLVCTRSSESVSNKKLRDQVRENNKNADNNNETQKKRAAYVSRKYHDKRRCVFTELTEIEMIGKIRIVKDKFYTLCCDCAGVIEFNAKKIGVDSLTCGTHKAVKDEQKSVFGKNRAYYELKSRACFNCRTFYTPENGLTTKPLFVEDRSSGASKLRMIYLCTHHYESMMNKTGKKNTLPLLEDIKSSFVVPKKGFDENYK